ncbi:MAG: glycosyltransferase family 2 protein [Anaerotruncus sp.]|nr:glycosyltransferase family 2 protein [Anaerotruncus sp.]
MQPNEIVIYTQAYNAANTLQRTIDSVRSQTYTAWRWLIVDNCSADATGHIIMQAAMKDPRIIPFRLERNNIAAYLKLWLLLKKNFPDCYFIDIDADDTVHPDCFESLLHFMRANALDIAACGTEFAVLDSQGNSVITRTRALEKDLILEGAGFAEFFPLYRPFTNEMWGKLYKFSVMEEEHMAVHSGYHYDSQLVLQLFQNSKRVGIFSKPLYRAYLNQGTLSQSIKGIAEQSTGSNPLEEQVFHWLDGTPYFRAISYQIAWSDVNMSFASCKEFLAHYGPLSPENREYLYAIYIGWIHENLVQLYLAHVCTYGHKFYKELLNLLHSDVFQEVFTYQTASEQYRNLQLRDAILEQMYHVVSISEYGVNNPEFVRGIKGEIQQLRKELEA